MWNEVILIWNMFIWNQSIIILYSSYNIWLVFFPDSLEFRVNQENIHPTLILVKAALALKSIDLKTISYIPVQEYKNGTPKLLSMYWEMP